MKRRDFLSASTQASVLLGSGQASGSSRQAVPPEMIGSGAAEAYFNEKALLESLAVSELERPSVQTVAFNFPSWHPSPFMEARFGRGWTEYETLKNCRALFPGHSMPHYPLWGYYNEAEPEWAEREIQLASTYGVDAWMIDWYWHNGTQFYQEQLESGFLKAANRKKLKFAVMWANHDWKNVYPAASPDKAAIIISQAHDLADFEKVATYCCEHYFSQPNYLTIEGAPVFALFDAGKLIQQLGETGSRKALDAFRSRALKLGFRNLHLQVCNGYDRYQERLGDFGFDSATMYGTFGWTYGAKPPGSRLPYGIGAKEAVAAWKEKKRHVKIPFFPACSVGWDDSPRFGEYASIAINRSPDQFERLVRAARHFTHREPSPKLIYIAAWNEWTEDHVLLPDTYWGYSYLEALKRSVG